MGAINNTVAALLRIGVTIIVASNTSPSASMGAKPPLSSVSRKATSLLPPLISRAPLTGISAPNSTITGQLTEA